MVFHVESLSSATFIDHIVYQIALDVYRILPDRDAVLATVLAPVEVKIALPISTMIYRSWTGVRPSSPEASTKADFRLGGASLRAASGREQSIGGPPRT